MGLRTTGTRGHALLKGHARRCTRERGGKEERGCCRCCRRATADRRMARADWPEAVYSRIRNRRWQDDRYPDEGAMHAFMLLQCASKGAREEGFRRIEFLTRLRHDARLHALPTTKRPKGKRGPMPVWGKKLPPPRQGGRWAGPWHVNFAFIYGRTRKVRWKEVVCLWRVLGHDVSVKAVVAEVEGYKERFTLVGSALELTGLQMVELFCCAVPARGRVPRPEAASGLGRVPRMDQESDRANKPGAMGDVELAASGAISTSGSRRG